MGFVRGNVMPILKEHAARPFSGHCLCLGQADVYLTFEDLQSIARIAQVDLPEGLPVRVSARPDLAMKGYISRETLFARLGFTQVSALDYSNFENVEYVFDLNSSEPPKELENKFDVIINHGTMEHVFHVPNCLANIYRMLRVGGRVIHSSPTSNYIDHGFYMFSPTFFYDYYTANQWNIRSLQVVLADLTRSGPDLRFYTDYEPGIFDHLSRGGLDANAYSVFCIAEKTGDSTHEVIPQQGFYSRIGDWDGQKSNDAVTEEIHLSPPFERESGNCWKKDLRDYPIRTGDEAGNPKGSGLKLFENDTGLGPAHSIHETIRVHGKGFYSHWDQVLYFSTSDNSDPNSNGRLYSIKAPRKS